MNLLDSHDVSRFFSLFAAKTREAYELAVLFSDDLSGMPSVLWG